MVDLCMVRDERRRVLVPATDLDYERLGRLPRGWPLDLHVTFKRTAKLNRFYRGIIAHVAEGIGVHPEQLHCDLKLKCGLIDQIFMSTEQKGIVAVKLRSTAFPEMEDLEFSEYVDRAILLIFRDYVPGIPARQQRKLIEEWAGRRPKLEDPPKLIIPR